MTEEGSVRFPYRNGAGNVAFVAGIVALVGAFVPFVVDFIADPAGVVAVACGWVGVGRVDKGTATNHRDAVVGAALGGAALFIVFLVFAATYVCSSTGTRMHAGSGAQCLSSAHHLASMDATHSGYEGSGRTNPWRVEIRR